MALGMVLGPATWADSSWRDLGEYCHLSTGEIYASGSESALTLCESSSEPISLLSWPRDSNSPGITTLNTSGMQNESVYPQNTSVIRGKGLR